MPDDFVIARNPEAGSTLPYLLRVPLGDGVVLKARETWPRTSKVYCHRADGWPDGLEIIERVAVRSCTRRGAAIDLVLERGRENRSQFVMTTVRGGRQAIFWQTARTSKQARPGTTVSRARAQGVVDLQIVVDSHERYAWKFSDQQATTRRGALPAGDYGVLDGGDVIASVERKGLQDLITSLTTGKLKFQLTELAALPRAAVVVEDRYSQALQHTFVRGSTVADGLAEAQVAFPNVPIMFCETRKLAQEWTYRFLAAAYVARELDGFGEQVSTSLASAPPLAPSNPTAAELRAWARAHGYDVPDRGRIPASIRSVYESRQ